MRVSSALAATAAILPSALAVGKHGFAVGSVIGSTTQCKKQSDWEADFDAIKASGSNIVRIYAAGQCDTAKNILPAAKAKDFKVVLGVWPDTPESLQNDKAALQQYVPQYKDQVYAVTVGSETLYRGNFTGPELLEKINEIKGVLPDGVRVGTADSWNKYADGTADAVIQGGVDILLANAFAYWQGAPIENATHVYLDDMMQALGRIQSVSGSLDKIEVWNGETGWPTDGGSDYEAASAGTKNAETFYQQGFCGLLDWGVNAFYFEAFDEPWKPSTTGDNGEEKIETVWGAMDANRKPKFSLACK
ncbi:family 17 glycosyl hydrolase [Elsinoe ampelina]|uniref:glucan 1,3-beta-glucosidase n=1 Tax=Elsinoe ampelina TaxID=302913 RepID=A0A6A6G5T4_9PEZI|nr:family 17 glycosyl hydrolase [Elsinoe ampelina]